MKNNKCFILLMLSTWAFLIGSCKKDFLEKKPATNISIPSTLNDLQLLLDNNRDLYKSPGIGQLSSDDILVFDNSFNSIASPYPINSYLWAKDVFAGQGGIDEWNLPYAEVLVCNVVLEQLKNITRDESNKDTFDNIKGTALFMRAFMFFDLTQVFTKPYDEATYNSDLGIPLRTVADVNAPSIRSTVRESYEQILSDALQATSLLNVNYVKNYFNRPSKAAAFGFLSRVYLSMRKYENARLYADSALMLHNNLIDYNTIGVTASRPFAILNDEILYNNNLVASDPLILVSSSQGFSIDTNLYKSYSANDLRKVILFSKNGSTINFKSNISGSRAPNNSIVTDELYITRAECYARAGNSDKALGDLNTLLSKRYKTGTYSPYSNLQGAPLLDLILKERRKEIVGRGLRWNDLRRLNKEGANIIPTRIANGKTYSLNPNDPKYALPIPPDVIALSGIQQNQR